MSGSLGKGFTLKIAIDARMITSGAMHGIARYVFELLNQLNQLAKNHQLFVLVTKDSPLRGEKWESHITFIQLRSKWISFSEQWEIPLILYKWKIDLFHSTSFVAPVISPAKMVMTIHDLNHIVLPHYYTPLHQIYYNTVVRYSIAKSKFILTVSQFSKKEIIEYLGLNPSKIFVTYNGVSETYRRVTDMEQISYIRDLYELPENFILCISNNKPHKNVLQLIRAYCHSNLEIPLVLACSVDSNMIQLAELYGKKHLIYFVRFIEEAHLPTIYSMTTLFVYPSTYEGFGLPPLEALACRARVLVSQTSSLPEVVGKYAMFTNPYDYEDMAKVLELAITDQKKANETMEGSFEHACGFSWRKMAQLTLEVYERCQ
jgi:glycosyltransferase involved in cell wall biosynthesis